MNWHRTAQAQHDRALGAPQPFALTGDGSLTRRLQVRANDPMAGAKLAEARYLDWLAQRIASSLDK